MKGGCAVDIRVCTGGADVRGQHSAQPRASLCGMEAAREGWEGALLTTEVMSADWLCSASVHSHVRRSLNNMDPSSKIITNERMCECKGLQFGETFPKGPLCGVALRENFESRWLQAFCFCNYTHLHAWSKGNASEPWSCWSTAEPNQSKCNHAIGTRHCSWKCQSLGNYSSWQILSCKWVIVCILHIPAWLSGFGGLLPMQSVTSFHSTGIRYNFWHVNLYVLFILFSFLWF